MTIESLPPVAEKNKRRLGKNKRVVDEKSPLLPKRQADFEFGHDGFNGASFSGAVFNLSTTIVGAGIMALPATMKVLGLVPGIAMVILLAFLTESSIEMLLRFSKPGQSASYGELMGEAFGKAGRILLQLCVVVNTVGVLIVYMIIIGNSVYAIL